MHRLAIWTSWSACVVLALAACSTPAPSVATQPTGTPVPPKPTATPAPAGSPMSMGVPETLPSPPAPPTPAPPLAVGGTATLPDGQTVTLHSVDYPDPAVKRWSQDVASSDGWAADVQWCAGPHPTGGVAKVGPINPFRLVLGDTTRVSVTTPFREPIFPDATLAAGDCTRGWVGFAVPPGKPPTQLVMELRDPATFQPILVRWSL